MFLLSLALSFVISTFASDKTTCSSRDLKRQDCRLTAGSYKLRLTEATVARFDGVWHTVDVVPLKGQWEKMQFSFLSGRPILQLWIWDLGNGEATVQALHWYVAELSKDKMHLLQEGIVRRRRPKGEKSEFIYDAWEKHSLKPLKDGVLEWSLGNESKKIEGAHGI